MSRSMSEQCFDSFYTQFKNTPTKSNFFDMRKFDLTRKIEKLNSYLTDLSFSSFVSYLFYFSDTPYIKKEQDRIVTLILKLARVGLIRTPEDLLLRLSVIDTTGNDRLAQCIESIRGEFRQLPVFSKSQQAIATFLNTFRHVCWDLDNIYNPKLFKIVEHLSIRLQVKLHELLVSSMKDDERTELFLTCIERCADCFTAANLAFSAGSLISKKGSKPNINDFLTALSHAMKEAAPLLSSKDPVDKLAYMTEKVPNLSVYCSHPSMGCDDDDISELEFLP